MYGAEMEALTQQDASGAMVNPDDHRRLYAAVTNATHVRGGSCLLTLHYPNP